jgi:hypothetical protein
MIPYRPIAPLTVGPRKGWKSVLSAVVIAALLGTTATAAVASEPAAQPASVPSVSTSGPGLPAAEPVRRES